MNTSTDSGRTSTRAVRRVIYLAIAFAAITFPVYLLAQGFVLTQFSAGTPISAADVNANFQAVAQQLQNNNGANQLVRMNGAGGLSLGTADVHGGSFDAGNGTVRCASLTATGTDITLIGGLVGQTGSVSVNSALGVFGTASITGNLNVTGNLIVGGGTKQFVQPHPTDPTKEISYVSLEGGEAGVYCRGSARLTSGKATIVLPEHFPLVCAERGITAQVTPTEECNGILVVKKSSTSIEVREIGGGKSSASFDWAVNGLRKGYEDHVVIRAKAAKH